MISPTSEVAVQRQAGGWSDRNDSALAAADGDQPGGQVDVGEFERDDSAGANRGLKHEADDGLVADQLIRTIEYRFDVSIAPVLGEHRR